MKRVCAYCKREYGPPIVLPPGEDTGGVTHGICADCLPAVEREIDDYFKSFKGLPHKKDISLNPVAENTVGIRSGT